MLEGIVIEELRRIAKAAEGIESCLRKLTETARVTTPDGQLRDATVDEPRTPTVTVA